VKQQQELPLQGPAGKELAVSLFCDGASRGNPGPASAGAVIKDAQGNNLATVSETLGVATNNRAEYMGLILGLEKAQKLGASQVAIFADSQLMVRQILGQYKVRDAGLKELVARAKKLLSGFRAWRAEHIPRGQNAEADALANRALDRAPVSRAKKG
jgi:ribonuclease HI